MKKLLYIDLLSPTGHDNYNMNMLRIMKSCFDVVFMARQIILDKIPDRYYKKAVACPDEMFPEYWKGKVKEGFSFALKWRKAQYTFVREIIKNSQSYDQIFFSSVDIFSFALATRGISCKNVFFVDHGIYRLKNPATRIVYKYLLNSSVCVIALEEYIKQYIVQNGIKNRIFVIHHPIPEKKSAKVPLNQLHDSFSIFAPSCSNDEGFISNLIKNVNLIPKEVKIVIKSREQKYQTENLVVFCSRIADDEYNKLFEGADFILVPYENDYNYRTSAILFEALNLGKRVLLWNNNTLHTYFDTFNKAVCVFSSVDEFIADISNIDDLRINESHIRGFMDRYSDDYIKRQMINAFN